MPQDAFTLLHTAKELNNKLNQGRIDKINQPDNDTVILQVRVGGENLKLILCANAENARVCTTTQTFENPLVAPNFCMLLRKHLIHAIITKIELVGLERIIKLTLKNKNELREEGEKIIYAEIMGKYSNVILVENKVILGALKPSTLDQSNLRPIFSGLEYKLPISQEKIEIYNENESLNKLSSFHGDSPETFLFNNFKGISKQTAIEIIYSYSIENNLESDFEKTFKTFDFYSYFKSFYVSPKINPNYTKNDFFITEYKSVNENKTYLSSIDETIDCYFSIKQNKKQFESKKNKLLTACNGLKKKLEKKLQIVLEKELSCKEMDKFKKYGELIMANLWQFKVPVSQIKVIDYSQSDYPEITIKLDGLITPKENAEKFFKKYNKLKKTLEAIAPQKIEIQQQLDYLSTIFSEIEQTETLLDFVEIEDELICENIIKGASTKKQTKKFSSQPRCYLFEGFEILVGKNNLQNDKLTLSAERMDIFVHTKEFHSSHVIIKTNGKSVPDKVIEFACQVCAYYSKARQSDKVPVDYTLKKFVKKPHGTKTGMVFYTNQKTILVTPNPRLENIKTL